jgi:hypothetical protein
MLLRCILLFFLCCTACRSGIIPCPEVKGLKLKKSFANKGPRTFDRRPQAEQPEPVITVSSEAKTLQNTSRNSNRYRYVEYTLQHVDVEELDCPKPGEKKKPKAVKENIRKNRKKIRYYYREASKDTLQLPPSASYPQPLK